MKGVVVIFDFFKVIKGILKRKNRQIRAEREKLRACELSNKILTAYIALLAQDKGILEIPKSEISEVLGSVESRIGQTATHYLIEVKRVKEDKAYRGKGVFRGE